MTDPKHQDSDSPKTAVQVLESFYDTHNIDKIKMTLLECFQGYALNDKKGFLKLNIGEQQISEVFDGLIELVAAVEKLKEEGKIEGLES